jgi:hypothetical protein
MLGCYSMLPRSVKYDELLLCQQLWRHEASSEDLTTCGENKFPPNLYVKMRLQQKVAAELILAASTITKSWHRVILDEYVCHELHKVSKPS